MRLADDALRAGYRLNSFDTLGSTNDEALRRAGAGDRGRLWIVAAAQTRGRGRQGRPWTSPPGNLYASLLLVDAVAPALAWQLGFVAGVALADAVAMATESGSIAIKWPNDLLAGDAKVAGILVEASRLANGAFAAVIGCGVNVASHPPGTPYPATDLAHVGALRPSRDEVFARLSARLPEVLALWEAGAGFAAVHALWLERALAPGTRLSVSTADGRRSGAFRTIDAAGRLILDTAEGRLVFDVGDVVSTEAPAPAG